jgi:biotin carboxyl carrier protein
VHFEANIAGGDRVRVEVKRKNGQYQIRLGDRDIEVDADESREPFLSLIHAGRSHEIGLQRTSTGYAVSLDDDVISVDITQAGSGPTARVTRSGPERLIAPMPGRIVRVLVQTGQAVEAGEGLMVMEAMKMENELRSPSVGTVRELCVQEGEAVETGALLALLE